MARKKKTEVVFIMLNGECLALMPGNTGDLDYYNTCASYMHEGQHGSASVTLLQGQRKATPDEYAMLKQEMEGYPCLYSLRIVTRVGHRQLVNWLDERKAQCTHARRVA